ncbi:MAG TPA: transcriptional regulator [Desulfotomaculum sp.]|nr:MAG: Transcriptional regulator, MarR family [Desulfotomaculum sp. 46_296]HAG11224.1 transcriptional regulator [Desulfotomaculum sp.]HBY03186.1 transcriptional regulator [Desulfotomaculum sp.]
MEEDSLSPSLERLEITLQQLIRRIHEKMDVFMAQGVTGSQFFVMKRIHERGKMTVSEVANELNVSLSAITALTDRLFKIGLIKRDRDEKDRRLVWLTMTPQGEKTLQDCGANRQEVFKKYLGDLTQGDLTQEDLTSLINICDKILALMKKEQ